MAQEQFRFSSQARSRPDPEEAAIHDAAMVAEALTGPESDETNSGTAATIEKVLKHFKPLLKKSSHRRDFLSASLTSTGASSQGSGSSKSFDDYGATSIAIAKVSNHLNVILQHSEAVSDRAYVEYLKRLEAIPEHKLLDKDVSEFKASELEWQLIKMAAQASAQVYGPLPSLPDVATFEASGDTKATIITPREIDGLRVLIVAIRGSATLGDWMLNVNGDLKQSPKLLRGTAWWHRGFLRVAEAMEGRIAKKIQEICQKVGEMDHILFTGHSAGGAIAQIFLASSCSANTRLSDAVSGFRTVDCITFGAPPVVSIPTPRGQFTPLRAGLGMFTSIINEGDPVPLAQEEYIKALVSVYLLSGEDLKELYPKGFSTPSPKLRVGGDCMILRDADSEDIEEEGFEAGSVMAEIVEKMLFGNPLVHPMQEYLERVELLVAASSRAEEKKLKLG